MSFDFYSRKFKIKDESKLAVVAEKNLTWREFQTRVEFLVQELRALDLPKGHPVIIRGTKEADFAVAILACMQCSLPYVPLDRIFPIDRVQKIRTVLGSQVLIQCGAPETVDVPVRIEMSNFRVDGRLNGTPAVIEAPVDDPIVYVIFTSGSTGEPKGVQISRKNVEDLLDWVQSKDFGFQSSDVFINQCSFSFDVSFFDLIASLQNGCTLILNSPEQIKSQDEFKTRLAPLKPTVWVSTPSFLSLALLHRDCNATHLPHLKSFYLAGEILHHSLVQRVHDKFPGAKVFNAYGPTEATVITTLVEASPELMSEYKAMPIGYVKPGTAIELLETFEDEGETVGELVGSSRVDLQACKLEYSIVSPK